jgi:hypothetical protein
MVDKLYGYVKCVHDVLVEALKPLLYARTVLMSCIYSTQRVLP